MTAKTKHPYHPIIYVRGFAATQGEIEDTVADPYMGFNIGSTKARVAWTGDVRRFYFESPLVRLMSDHQYQDVFVEGDDLVAADHSDRRVPYRCIVIYRYYDEASADFGEAGVTPPIEHFARGLGRLIARLRDKVCANPDNDVSSADFRVYLVAHSMGGLVCRAFLQNAALGEAADRRAVDKCFTYATPHNGIDLRIVRNVPGWFAFGDVNNFNRARMAEYMALDDASDVSRIVNFPADRMFNLVGTNARDYTAVRGLSAWAAGEASDGLVRIDNATTRGEDANGRAVSSPRAFVNRSHSGYYGIVNSEEGYQNLTRFLFGGMRVDGHLDIDAISLPTEVQNALDAGRTIRASYQFEIAVSLRGCQWEMTRRVAREHSAIFRTYDRLFPEDRDGQRAPDRRQSPHLFSVFLDPNKSVKQQTKAISFAFDLKVLVPDYEVDGLAFLNRHYEGGFIYRDLILVEAIPDANTPSGWRAKYGFQSTNPGKPGIAAEAQQADPSETDGPALGFDIPIEQTSRPGLCGRLRIEARRWQ